MENQDTEFFCHECDKVVQINGVPDSEEVLCSECSSPFIEKRQISSSDSEHDENTTETGCPTENLPNRPPRQAARMLEISFPVLMVQSSANLGEAAAGESGFNNLLHRLFMESQPKGPPPTAAFLVENLVENKRVVSEADLHGEACLDCPVCQEQLKQGDEVVELKCSHVFCEDCIVPWLKQRNSCPVCRTELETDDADYEKIRQARETTATTQEQNESSPL